GGWILWRRIVWVFWVVDRWWRTFSDRCVVDETGVKVFLSQGEGRSCFNRLFWRQHVFFARPGVGEVTQTRQRICDSNIRQRDITVVGGNKAVVNGVANGYWAIGDEIAGFFQDDAWVIYRVLGCWWFFWLDWLIGAGWCC